MSARRTKRKFAVDEAGASTKRSRLELCAELIQSAACRSQDRDRKLFTAALERLDDRSVQELHTGADEKKLIVKAESRLHKLPLGLLDQVVSFLDFTGVAACSALSVYFAEILRNGRWFRHCWPPAGYFTAGALNKLRSKRIRPEILTCTDITFDTDQAEVLEYVSKLRRVQHVQLLGTLQNSWEHTLLKPLFAQVATVTFRGADSEFVLQRPGQSGMMRHLPSVTLPHDMELYHLPDLSIASMPQLTAFNFSSEGFNWTWSSAKKLDFTSDNSNAWKDAGGLYISDDDDEVAERRDFMVAFQSVLPFLRNRPFETLALHCGSHPGTLLNTLSLFPQFRHLQNVSLVTIAFEPRFLAGLSNLTYLRLQECVLLINNPWLDPNQPLKQWILESQQCLQQAFSGLAESWRKLAGIALYDVRAHFELDDLEYVLNHCCIDYPLSLQR